MRALVTGAGGFLGGVIARMLRERRDEVRSLARGDYPHLAASGIKAFRGDVADPRAVHQAMKDCDVVFHVAAKAGIAGSHEAYHQANVVGTRNVIEACLNLGVKRLVFTSSPSVVFHGGDLEGVDESLPYPDHFPASYPQTKAEAERLVRAANGAELATVSLRPHLIWGPGDNHILPRLVQRARSGRLRRIGTANKRVDGTYVDNAALAHLLAADHLSPGCPIGGKVYFIAQGEPIGLWDLVARLLATADLPPVERSIPQPLAYALGAVLEKTYSWLGLSGDPPMTRFLAGEMATAHWFDLTAARRDLGYEAKVSMDEGLVRLRAWVAAGGLTSHQS